VKEKTLLKQLSKYGATIREGEFIAPDGLGHLSLEEIGKLSDLATRAEKMGLIDPRPPLWQMYGSKKIHDATAKTFILAIIRQAILDLRSRDIVEKLDAFLWLTSDEFPLWSEALGVPDVDGFQILTSGRIRKRFQYIKSKVLEPQLAGA
jgi:hypothetical protein